MMTEEAKESYLWKVNKSTYVVADSVAEAELVYHKHYSELSVYDVRKTSTVYL